MSKKEEDAAAYVVHTPEMVAPSQLVDAVYNPNKMTPEQYDALKESIREHGFVEPVVVQKIGMRIIGGHHRVRAIKELSIEAGTTVPRIPCVVLDVDDATAKRLNLKLQHIHGAPDARLLGELLVDIFDLSSFTPEPVNLLGLDLEDASKYIRLVEPEFFPAPAQGDVDPVTSFGRLPSLSLEFEMPEVRDAVKAVLEERSGLEKKKSGDVVAIALGIRRKGTTTRSRVKKTARTKA